MSRALSTPLSLLREVDPQRYLACLYLPSSFRDDVATLWAFDTEIARIPGLVTDPMPGEIRLQWWRDLLASGNNAGAGPLAGHLTAVIDRHDLPRETFHAYLNARAFDFYNDPMPDMATLEGYLGETVSVWFQLGAICAGIRSSTVLANASGHAGMAVGLVYILANTLRHRSRQQVYAPLTLVKQSGLSEQDWIFGEPGPIHEQVIGDVVAIARDHHNEAFRAIRLVPREAKSLFLQLALSDAVLKKIEKSPGSVFRQSISLNSIAQHWYLFRAALK